MVSPGPSRPSLLLPTSHAGGEGAVYVFPFPSLPSSGIVNAASFAHTVAPGSIVSMFGTNFANSPGAHNAVAPAGRCGDDHCAALELCPSEIGEIGTPGKIRTY